MYEIITENYDLASHQFLNIKG